MLEDARYKELAEIGQAPLYNDPVCRGIVVCITTGNETDTIRAEELETRVRVATAFAASCHDACANGCVSASLAVEGRVWRSDFFLPQLGQEGGPDDRRSRFSFVRSLA